MGSNCSHDALRLRIVGAAKSLNEFEELNGILISTNCGECSGRLEIIFKGRCTLMEDNNESVLHPVVVLVLARRCLFMLFLPEVLLNVGDWDNLVRCRVDSRERLGRKCNHYWQHVSDSLGDAVAFFELEMVRNVVEGSVKLGGVVQSSVVEDIILDLVCLALEFFSCGCSRGMVPAVALAAIVDATIVIIISPGGGGFDFGFFLFIQLP